jgi:serine O-acetyltransferase
MTFAWSATAGIKACPLESKGPRGNVSMRFSKNLPGLARLLASDVDAAFNKDPAAGTLEEIFPSYPSIEAITVQRLAHRLYRLEIPFVPG